MLESVFLAVEHLDELLKGDVGGGAVCADDGLLEVAVGHGLEPVVADVGGDGSDGRGELEIHL